MDDSNEAHSELIAGKVVWDAPGQTSTRLSHWNVYKSHKCSLKIMYKKCTKFI